MGVCLSAIFLENLRIEVDGEWVCHDDSQYIIFPICKPFLLVNTCEHHSNPVLGLLLGCVVALDLDAATMNTNLEAESNLHTDDFQKLQGVIDLIASIAVVGVRVAMFQVK